MMALPVETVRVRPSEYKPHANSSEQVNVLFAFLEALHGGGQCNVEANAIP